jgi:hypothetical protein
MSPRRILGGVAALAVIGAAVVLIASAISTSSARVSANTSGQSFFAAGTVSLRQPDAAVEMLFDADGLYPGVEVTGCVDIEYTGSVPAALRVHGERLGGTGLDDYVDLRMQVAPGGCTASADEDAGTTIYDARLATMWLRHADYDSGVTVASAVRPGDRLALHASATIADDNRAQGLTTDFSITIEARP